MSERSHYFCNAYQEERGNRPLGDILEKGTSRMKPRPYKQAVVDRAMPRIKELYKFKK